MHAEGGVKLRWSWREDWKRGLRAWRRLRAMRGSAAVWSGWWMDGAAASRTMMLWMSWRRTRAGAGPTCCHSHRTWRVGKRAEAISPYKGRAGVPFAMIQLYGKRHELSEASCLLRVIRIQLECQRADLEKAQMTKGSRLRCTDGCGQNDRDPGPRRGRHTEMSWCGWCSRAFEAKLAS